jgi:hypothetical protein
MNVPLHMLPYQYLDDMQRELILDRQRLLREMLMAHLAMEDCGFDNDGDWFQHYADIYDELEFELELVTERLVEIQKELKGTIGYKILDWDANIC